MEIALHEQRTCSNMSFVVIRSTEVIPRAHFAEKGKLVPIASLAPLEGIRHHQDPLKPRCSRFETVDNPRMEFNHTQKSKHSKGIDSRNHPEVLGSSGDDGCSRGGDDLKRQKNEQVIDSTSNARKRDPKADILSLQPLKLKAGQKSSNSTPSPVSAGRLPEKQTKTP